MEKDITTGVVPIDRVLLLEKLGVPVKLMAVDLIELIAANLCQNHNGLYVNEYDEPCDAKGNRIAG